MVNIAQKEVKLVLVVLVLIVLIYGLFQIKMAVLPFAFGIILAFLFNPFIAFLEKRNYSRQGAVLLLIILVFNITFIAGLFLFPVFINELQNLTTEIPEFLDTIAETIDYFNQQYQRIALPPLLQESLNQLLQEVEAIVVEGVHLITEMMLTSIPLAFSLLVAPIISFYILKDLNVIKKTLIGLIPDDDRNLSLKIAREINHIFVGFLRGQIWISIIVGILAGIGLYFFEVKFFLLLGVVAGVTNIIPYIGPIIGAIPAVFISFLDSPLKAAGVILMYVVIQQVESNVFAPKIMSTRVGIHPLTIIFSLLAGAELAGIWGLLLGIPVAGSIKVIINLLGTGK